MASSSSSGSSTGTYIYTKTQFSVGPKTGQNVTKSIGLTSSTEDYGASIELSRNQYSCSITIKDATYTVTHNAQGDSMQILLAHQEGYESAGVYEEYGVSRLAEYAIAASAYAIIVCPECAPAVVGFAQRVLPSVHGVAYAYA